MPGHWNSEKIAPSKRVMRAQELSHEAFDAACGQQFLIDACLPCMTILILTRTTPIQMSSTGLNPWKASLLVPVCRLLRGNQVAIVRVPAASAEELPAYFEWGGWNDAPEPQTIVAVARYWRETCGAELVALGPDLLEFYVPRKPQDHSAAIALLKEQYVFSPDSFEFDQTYLEHAAAQLRMSSSWVFWWD